MKTERILGILLAIIVIVICFTLVDIIIREREMHDLQKEYLEVEMGLMKRQL